MKSFFLPRSGLNTFSVGLPIVIFAGLFLVSPHFRDVGNLTNIGNQIAPLVIVAVGQMLVAIAGGIDLSVGSVMSVTSALLASHDAATGIALALLVGLATGLVNGLGSIRFGVHPLVMTLSTGTILQGLALYILPAPGGRVAEWLQNMAMGRVLGLPSSFIWMALAIGLTCWLLYMSRFGVRLFALGANAHSAMLNGVSPIRIPMICYLLSALFAVAAGIYLTARVSAGDAGLGSAYSLDSVTAIALGGVQLAGGAGSVLGAVLGAATLGMVSNGVNLLGISPFIRTAIVGGLLLFAISLQRRKVVGV